MLKWKRFGWTVKDERYRKTYKKVELQKNILKSMLYSPYYKNYYKLYFKNCFLKYSKTTSLGIYRNYCLFTYTGKVVFKRFKISRHVFKYMASMGYLTGFKKSSF